MKKGNCKLIDFAQAKLIRMVERSETPIYVATLRESSNMEDEEFKKALRILIAKGVFDVFSNGLGSDSPRLLIEISDEYRFR